MYDSKHPVYDTKYSIWDSKHSFCQPDDSKHSTLWHFGDGPKKFNMRARRT